MVELLRVVPLVKVPVESGATAVAVDAEVDAAATEAKATRKMEGCILHVNTCVKD